MLDFVLVCASTVLVCASTVLVCASTVLVCASTVLVCASICFFVLARKSTRKHISFGDDSTHATYGTHMYIPVSVNTYVLIQDLAGSVHPSRTPKHLYAWSEFTVPYYCTHHFYQ